MIEILTPWNILALFVGAACLLGVALQHRAERSRPEGRDFERGFAAGLEQGARIIEATGDSQGSAHARTIRAARRTP